MKTHYKSYVRAFDQYATSGIDNILLVSLTNYALLTTLKANQLVTRGKLNKLLNLTGLQTELFESGKLYILEHSMKLKINRELLRLVAINVKGI